MCAAAADSDKLSNAEREREENVSRQKKEKEIKSRRPSATLSLFDMKNAD